MKWGALVKNPVSRARNRARGTRGILAVNAAQGAAAATGQDAVAGLDWTRQ